MNTLTIRRGQNKRTIRSLFSKWVSERQHKGIDAKRFSGIIKLDKDPLIIQRELRSEWN